MLRKWIALSLLLCLMLPLNACATEDEEEVSLETYFTTDGGETTPAPDETTAVVNKAAPVYELDGSIVVTMTFTGDFTIGENLNYNGKSIFEKELEKQKGDINFPFRNVKEILEADDLTVVNFEGTLTTAGKNQDRLDHNYLFRAKPEYAAMLPDNGVDAVSLQNNHVDDCGADGLAETKESLTSVGIPYASEDEPAIMTVRGVKIGLLAYCTVSDDNEYPRLFEKVPQDIAALREQGCEIVVVNCHWGQELDYAPNDNQQKLGKLCIDSGADLVIGHHSHRINPIEEYNGKYICYSLGNFSFCGNSKPDDMSTFIFQVKMRVKDGAATPDGFIIIPSRISSKPTTNDFAPTPYTKQENIESVLSVLRKNGKKLTSPVEDYPLSWPGEE